MREPHAIREAGDDPLAWYRTRRETLIAEAVPGTESARALSDLTDEAVLGLTRAASAGIRRPFAIFALGGYGARRLLPRSDVDLLVVSDSTAADLETLVRGVIYPLWDAGLDVGHQVRTRSGQVVAVRGDITVATSFLSSRFIAGDSAFAERITADVSCRVVKDRRRLRAEMRRRVRPGSPYLLEPDLKEGAGGQRDIDEILWRVALEDPSARHPVDPELMRAQDVITDARWRLHANSPRARNLMRIADAVALGIDADAAQAALEAVHHRLLAERRREHPASGARVGTVTVSDLIEAARTGAAALPELEEAARDGRLDHAIPGFASMMTLRRPGLSHHYTVGAHSLHTLVALYDDGPPPDGPDAHSGLTAALVVAALVHDVGKREPGEGHADRGARDAVAAAARLGLPAQVCEDAGVLVREHLLFSEVATSRDLTDEDVILEAAARIQRRELVRPLLLLTAADMTATGPDVWTAWRRALVTELALKVDAAMSPDTDGAGIVQAAHACRDEAVRRALGEGASRAVLSFIETAPLRYLAHRTPVEVLRDGRLVQSLSGPGAFDAAAVCVARGRTPGTWVVDVATRDRIGLFGTIAGVLALSGFDTLRAEAFTSHRGVAIDMFVVKTSADAPADDLTWQTFEERLTDALTGRSDLAAVLRDRGRHYARAGADGLGECRVTVGPRGAFSSSVRVHARDRMGLLYDLAHTVERAGFDISRAVITTRADTADDVFELTDAEGLPPSCETLEAVLAPLLVTAARFRT